MGTGMAIEVLLEALLPGGGGAEASGGGQPPPKDEKGLKEWIRSKLKALASLLGKSGMKAAEHCISDRRVLHRVAIPIITYKLDSQLSERCSGLCITKSSGSGCRHWRIDLYVYGNQKIIILRYRNII